MGAGPSLTLHLYGFRTPCRIDTTHNFSWFPKVVGFGRLSRNLRSLGWSCPVFAPRGKKKDPLTLMHQGIFSNIKPGNNLLSRFLHYHRL